MRIVDENKHQSTMQIRWQISTTHIGKVLHPNICTSPLCIYGGRYPPRILERSCTPIYTPVHCAYMVVDIHHAYCKGFASQNMLHTTVQIWWQVSTVHIGLRIMRIVDENKHQSTMQIWW